MTTKYYLGPKFSVNKTVEEHRNAFESLSKLTLLPLGTKTERVSFDGIKAEWVSVSKVAENKVKMIAGKPNLRLVKKDYPELESSNPDRQKENKKNNSKK